MGTSLCVLPMILASCISQEVVQNEEEEEAKDSTKDPTQVSSSVASSPCQESIFMKRAYELLPSLLLNIYLSILHPSPICLLL